MQEQKTMKDLVVFLEEVDSLVLEAVDTLSNPFIARNTKIQEEVTSPMRIQYNFAKRQLGKSNIKDKIKDWRNYAITQNNPIFFTREVVKYYNSLTATIIQYANHIRKLDEEVRTTLKKIKVSMKINTIVLDVNKKTVGFFGLESKFSDKDIIEKLENMLKDSIENADSHYIK